MSEKPIPDSFSDAISGELRTLDQKIEQSRFYIDPSAILNGDESPVGRLLGNRVLLRRAESEMVQSDGGIWLRDHYKHGSPIFKVLAIGPGGYVKQFNKRGKFRLVWIEPQVFPGDMVLSYHWTAASEHPDWIQPQYLDDAGGAGRVVLDARHIVLRWSRSNNSSMIL